MTPAEETADAALQVLTRIIGGYPELARRARISSRPDGYPRRASGAQPGTVGPQRETRTYTLSTSQVASDPSLWGWSCTCGGDPWKGISGGACCYPSSLAALEAGQRHHDAVHPTGSAISYSDPTGTSAEQLVDSGGHRPDPVTRRLRTLERNLNTARRHLEAAAAQLVDPRDTDDNLAWCESCSRVKHPDGAPYLEPVYSKAKGKTDVGGRLADPRYLCRFDYDYVLSEGRLPPVEFTRERLTKGRAPRKIA